MIVSKMTITGGQYLINKLPLVYVWTRAGEYLYIGLGACGIGRIFTNHPYISLASVEEGDEISWTFYSSVAEAKLIERTLIKEHKPKYNKYYLNDRMNRLR